MLLLSNYLQLGAQKNVKKWPKAIFPIMARTTFTKMLHLLDPDDQEWITENLDNWVDFVVAAAGLSDGGRAAQGSQGAAKAQPVIGSVFDDLEAGKHHRLATTREDWRKDMPQNDRLSRGHDAWFEGMGEYGSKTDKLLPPEAEAMASQAASSMAPQLAQIVERLVDEDAGSAEPQVQHAALPAPSKQGASSSKPAPSAEAPLFELRALGNKQISQWEEAADTAFAQIDEALGGAQYGGPGWKPKTPAAPAQGSAQHQPDSGEFQETEDPTQRYRPRPNAAPIIGGMAATRVARPQTAERRRSCKCVIMSVEPGDRPEPRRDVRSQASPRGLCGARVVSTRRTRPDRRSARGRTS